MERVPEERAPAPTMPQYFLGYGIIFGGVIALALALVLAMKLFS